MQKFVDLIEHESKTVISPALRVVGNIVTGDDEQTQRVLNCNLLKTLKNLLTSLSNHSIVKEACWTLSNITAGNERQIQVWITFL
jgi:hypothetical protein